MSRITDITDVCLILLYAYICAYPKLFSRPCLFVSIYFISGEVVGAGGGGRKVKGGSINYRVFHSLTVLPVTSADSDGIARFKWPQPFLSFICFFSPLPAP